MRFLTGSISLLLLFSISKGETDTVSPSKLEINREIQRLEKLREEIKKLISENRKLMKKIQEEKKKLAEEKKKFEEEIKKIEKERYKKLAKVFEKAVDEDPELAAERISKMDPVKAAYIVYNMKESKAGVLMDYVDPKQASKIVKIISQLKKANKN
jgi:flagellar motility protein MotE (MotC chaperone)